VNNVTYQGIQAQGGTHIANIQKEAVELKTVIILKILVLE